MVFMPAESTGKKRKLLLPYYGPYRFLEVGTNTLLVRPVDKSAEQAIMINLCHIRGRYQISCGWGERRKDVNRGGLH